MKISCFVFCFLFFVSCFAQGDNIIKSRSLINFETHLVPSSFDFVVQHRFGKIEKENIIDDFFGTDLAGNISFGFTKPLKNDDCLDLFRYKKNKVISFGYKKSLMIESSSFPVNLSFYASVGVKTGTLPVFSDNAFFEDLETPFEYKFSHRVDYAYQLILSKNLSEKVYVQLNPGFVYKNLIDLEKESRHYVFCPVSFYYKYSFSSAFVFEYGFFEKRFLSDYYETSGFPLSLGFEWGTAGHIFQVFVSNNQNIRTPELFVDFYEHQRPGFSFGFNIKRSWWF
tara:strand:+ start:2858 stop:3706 length:849 start_codon:yes stop_codon:yes gene_type:complete